MAWCENAVCDASLDNWMQMCTFAFSLPLLQQGESYPEGLVGRVAAIIPALYVLSLECEGCEWTDTML